MKRILISFLAVVIGLTIACNKENSEPGPASSTVTVPFTARFAGIILNDSPLNMSGCGSEFSRIIEVANGKGDCVGFSTLVSDFCFNQKELKVGYSYIRTSKGDTLFVSLYGKTCKGLDIPDSLDNDHPDEICCWNIAYTILGGTGLFRGAAGSGTTDDYLSKNDNTFCHSWQGTITLQKDQYEKMKY
jgi:hypothetical protein